MKEYTYCDRAGDHGDAMLWRSHANLDGSPCVSHFRAQGDALYLLDCDRAPFLLTIHKGDSVAGHALTAVAYVGSLATVLSEMVERIA